MTADGRTLDVLLAGPADGFPLVFHHGTPQGAVPFPFLEKPASARGLRVIAYSRPGYGGSTPRPDADSRATVADDALDVAAILDALDLDQFVPLGWSGGGPRALACAAVLPGRCKAAACGVGIAPPEADGFDFLEGMGPENVAEYTAVRQGWEALSAWLEEHGTPLFSVTGDQVVEAMGGLLPPVDQAALTGELAEWLAASTRRAGEQGIVGWRDDDLTHSRPWGFDVRDIAVPVSIWQGSEDRMVPHTHARWLAAHVPGAHGHFVEGEGHLSLIAQMDVILDDLLEMAGH